MEERNEPADKEDHIITDDFLSWILLDLDSRGAAKNADQSAQPASSGDSTMQMSLQEASALNIMPVRAARKESTMSVSSGDNGGDNAGDSNDSDNHQPGQKRKVSRSRELAKESRKRQRQRMEEMEKKITTLKKENEELQAYLQNVTQRTTQVQKQRLDMERIMSAKLCDMSTMAESSSDLEEVLRKFVDLYADYGSCRQKEVLYYVWS
jgi:vesicle coat complex subunit